MTHAELIDLIRQDYLHDTVDAVDVDDSDYRWPTSFLLRSLYEAARQVCRRKRDAIYDETTTAIVHPTIVASTRTMAIDSRIIDIDWMTIGTNHDKIITKTSRERLEYDNPAWRNYTTTDYPTQFFIAGNAVYWDKLPSTACAAETCNLGVWRYPLAPGGLADEPEVQEHRDLIHWVLFECYKKDDPDSGETRDDRKALDHLALFDAAYGKPMRHDVLAAKREAPRDFSMVGSNYFGNLARRGSGLR